VTNRKNDLSGENSANPSGNGRKLPANRSGGRGVARRGVGGDAEGRASLVLLQRQSTAWFLTPATPSGERFPNLKLLETRDEFVYFGGDWGSRRVFAGKPSFIEERGV
jgi:hypothetical protein